MQSADSVRGQGNWRGGLFGEGFELLRLFEEGFGFATFFAGFGFGIAHEFGAQFRGCRDGVCLGGDAFAGGVHAGPDFSVSVTEIVNGEVEAADGFEIGFLDLLEAGFEPVVHVLFADAVEDGEVWRGSGGGFWR